MTTVKTQLLLQCIIVSNSLFLLNHCILLINCFSFEIAAMNSEAV